MLARADGFLTMPAQGEWKLESTVPLDKAVFNLEQSIPRGHYIEKVKPDYTAMRRNAFQHTDLSKLNSTE